MSRIRYWLAFPTLAFVIRMLVHILPFIILSAEDIDVSGIGRDDLVWEQAMAGPVHYTCCLG